MFGCTIIATALILSSIDL